MPLKLAAYAPKKNDRVQIEMRVEQCNGQSCKNDGFERPNDAIVWIKTPAPNGGAERTPPVEEKETCTYPTDPL